MKSMGIQPQKVAQMNTNHSSGIRANGLLERTKWTKDKLIRALTARMNLLKHGPFAQFEQNHHNRAQGADNLGFVRLQFPAVVY